MVDALDSKSSSFTGVSVRVWTRGTNPLAAPPGVGRYASPRWTRGPASSSTKPSRPVTDEARGACRDDHRQARPAARVADPDRRHRPDRRTAVRAPGRRRILHAGDGGAGRRDRAGAAARMVRAARRALAPRGRAVRHHLPRRSPFSRSGRSSSRRPTGSRWCRTASPRSARRSSRCSTSTRTSTGSSTARHRRSQFSQEHDAHGPDRDAQFDARAC